MSKTIVSFAGKSVVLTYNDFDDELNVDDLTKIDYSNLFGEIVTVSALLNKVGLLKAEAEEDFSKRKLECDIWEAQLQRQYRREANINAGKFSMPNDDGTFSQIKLTEESLKNAILLDVVFQNKKKGVIESQKNLGFIDSLYWSVQSKDRKLSVIMKPTTPEDFYNELIEGSINTIIIKKPVDTWATGKK